MKFKLLMSLVAVATVAQAAVKLGMPSADRMALQRGEPVAARGTVALGEKVEVPFPVGPFHVGF